MKNNKGAALANIMLISAFVMVLASGIISIAMSNYRIKLVNINSKNNFYSCEAVLDEMRIGLRNYLVTQNGTDAENLSALFEKYRKKAKYTGDAGYSKTHDIYNVEMLAELVDFVEGEEVVDWRPQGEGDGFAYKTVVQVQGKGDVNVTISAADEEYYKTNSLREDQEQYNFICTSTYVIFKNIKVTLEQNGYENSIVSDIKLNYYGESDDKPTGEPLNDYSVVSQGSLYAYRDVGVSITFEGNVYFNQINASKITSQNTISDLQKNADYSIKNDKQNFALYLASPNQDNNTTTIKIGEKTTATDYRKAIINGDIFIEPNTVLDFSECDDVYINGSIVYVKSDSLTNNFKKGEIKTSSNTKIHFTENTKSSTSMGNVISSESKIFRSVYQIYIPDINVVQLADSQNSKGDGLYYNIGTTNKGFQDRSVDQDNYAIRFAFTGNTSFVSNKINLLLNLNRTDVKIQNISELKVILLSDGCLYPDGVGKVVFKKISDEEYAEITKMSVSMPDLKGYETEEECNKHIGNTDSAIQRNNVEIPIKEYIQNNNDMDENQDSAGSKGERHTELAISYDNWRRT